MENNINMEQPIQLEQVTANVNEQIIEENSAIVNSDTTEGSNFGKFKDATSLLNAYNNLEKEFTKKSQKLSELMKNNQTTTEEQINSIKEVSEPIFKSSNWQTKVSDFFEKTPEAKPYAKEIAATIISDKDLAKNKNCLDYAYALAELKHKVKPADLLNDPKHLEDIFANENIKNKIIANYIQSVSQSKHNLRFISGEANSITPTQPSNKPKSIKEASNILKKLLQS